LAPHTPLSRPGQTGYNPTDHFRLRFTPSEVGLYLVRGGTRCVTDGSTNQLSCKKPEHLHLSLPSQSPREKRGFKRVFCRSFRVRSSRCYDHGSRTQLVKRSGMGKGKERVAAEPRPRAACEPSDRVLLRAERPELHIYFLSPQVSRTIIRGPPTKGKTTLLKRKPQAAHNLTITQNTCKSHTLPQCSDPQGPSNQGSGHPRVNLHYARGSSVPRIDLHLVRGSGTPRAVFRLARGSDAPRANLRLARGSPSTRGASPVSPDRSIKCPDTLGHHSQKTNPRQADLLTPPGNLAPALCSQSATVQPSPVLCGRCTRTVRRGRCHSKTLCRLLQSFPHAVPLEKA
jgi:hypothetical protein